MRQRLAAVAMMCAVLATTACSRSAPTGSTSSTPPAQTALKQILYINPLPGDGLWDKYGACMTAEAAKYKIGLRTIGPPGGAVNVQAMENMLSQAVATRAQAIVTWSDGAPAAFDALFAQARAHGAVIATLLSVGDTKNQNVEFGYGVGEEARFTMAAIAARRGHQYVGVLSQRVGYSAMGNVADLRTEAAKYPNVTLVDVEFDGGQFGSDINIVSTMLLAHPQINVVANYNTFPGALGAIKEVHRVGKVVAFTGYEPSNPSATVEAIDQGLVAGVRVSDNCGMARAAVDRLIDAWSGKPIRSFYGGWTRNVSGTEFKQLYASGKL